MLKYFFITFIIQICVYKPAYFQHAQVQHDGPPWLVYFEVKNKRCGGAMIDDYHVLTAAHCFDSIKTSEYAVLRKLREAIKIRIGEWKTETDPDCGEDVSDEICDTTADIFPKEVIIHEKYNKRHYDKRYQYDIAIIKLGWPPRRSEVISVLRLAEPERCQEATSGEYWKATGFGGGSKVKKRMEMILLSHEECVKSIDPSHLKKLNADVHVCGRGLSGEKTCQGDAGSPVTNLVEGIPYLQGIVTFTDEDVCVETETNTASVFLRVPCFYDWIHSKVPNISHAFIEKPEPKPSSNEDTGSIEVITVGESTTARPLGTTLGNRRKPEPVTTTTPRPRSTTRPTTPRTTTRSTTTSRRVVTTPAVVTEADEGNGDDTMRTSTDGMNCGQPKIGRQTMIGGSYVVERGRYPWHAAILFGQNYQCGATVISNKRVVTAAHCVKGKQRSHEYRAGDILVSLGVHDLSIKFEIGRVTFAVKSINIHPDWNINVQTFDADIAILELDSEITFNNYIQPICLAQPESSVASNSSGIVIGFGRSENKGIEDVAKILEIPLIDYHKCSEGEDQRHLISPRTFCGGTKDGRGVCDGDSGSGVYVIHNGRTYLRGIVSSSLSTVYECDVNKYAVFTEVTKFYDWINYESIKNGDLKVTTLGTRRKPEPVTTTTPRPRPTTTPRTTTRSTTTSRRVVTTPAVVTEANDGNDQDENGEGGNGGDGNGEDGNGEGENGEGGQDEQGSQEPDTTAKVTPRTTPRTTQIRASTRPWRKPTTSKPKTTTTVEPTVESTTEDETIHFKDPSKTDLSSELDVRAAADNSDEVDVYIRITTTTAEPLLKYDGRAQKYIKPTIETTTVNERSHFTQFEVNERMQWYRPSVSWFQNQRSFS